MRNAIIGFLAASALCCASSANAQLDRDAGITVKRNIGPFLTGNTQTNVPGTPNGLDVITGIDRRGLLPTLVAPTGEQARNDQLNDSYSFAIHGSYSTLGSLWQHDSIFPSSYIGVITLDGAGNVTSYRIEVGDVVPTGTFDCATSCGSYVVASNGAGRLTLPAVGDHTLAFSLAVAEGGNHVFLRVVNHELTPIPGRPGPPVAESATGEMRRQ